MALKDRVAKMERRLLPPTGQPIIEIWRPSDAIEGGFYCTVGPSAGEELTQEEFRERCPDSFSIQIDGRGAGDDDNV